MWHSQNVYFFSLLSVSILFKNACHLAILITFLLLIHVPLKPHVHLILQSFVIFNKKKTKKISRVLSLFSSSSSPSIVQRLTEKYISKNSVFIDIEEAQKCRTKWRLFRANRNAIYFKNSRGESVKRKIDVHTTRSTVKMTRRKTHTRTAMSRQKKNKKQNSKSFVNFTWSLSSTTLLLVVRFRLYDMISEFTYSRCLYN